MTSTLVELFRHNLWANLRLIDACRGLSDAQLDAAPAGGVFGAVRATLRHIVVNEERYLKSLLGQRKAACWHRDSPQRPEQRRKQGLG